MKIRIDKENEIEPNGLAKISASRGCVLVINAKAGYEVKMDYGKIVVTCKKFTVKERKSKDGECE